MHRVLRWLAAGMVVTSSLSGCSDDPVRVPDPAERRSGAPQRGGFEVWLVDQSNSPGLTYGGTIYVFDGAALMGEAASKAEPTSVVDLAAATASLCVATTGANPVRPHMLFFNSTHTHGVLAFVASGHVVIFDAASRAPVACLRASAGAGGARQAHAAVPAPDDSYILVANQNGKLVERIDANFATNAFTLNAAATLNLATCTTPNGLPCENATLRPDNAPICPVVASTGDLAFVTLRGGGLFVINPETTPMAIRAEYDRATVHPNGCGGAEAAGWMFIDSGGGTAANLFEFDVYRFALGGISPTDPNPPNVPAPDVLFSDHSDERDAHGMVLTKASRYLWVADRGTNVSGLFDVASGARVNTVDMRGPDSADPAPDLADVAPSGNRLFFSLRGSVPLTGDPHVATGSTPGLGVYQVLEGGRTGFLKDVVRIWNVDAGGVNRADPHAIRVRLK